MGGSDKNYWVVGSTFRGSDDQAKRFVEHGIWEIDNPTDADRQQVRKMLPGDAIAIKAAFVQKHGLPFDSKGQSVSVLRLKARGTVTSNPESGDRVEVDWDHSFQPKEWYFFTFRGTIWQLTKDREEGRRLIQFAFFDEPQDYAWFLAAPHWRDRLGPPGGDSAGPAVWIEKTLVRGREDREQGEHALGKALWSPQTSKSGGDIYANMRSVKPGDYILHLTDNKAFTGVSIAAAAAEGSFRGVVGTEWQGECFRIELRDYQELDPPLLREHVLKTEPYAAQLRELISSGVKGLFFNSNLELNQGAYLTEATPTLVSVLNRAYQDVAGKPLPIAGGDGATEPEASVVAEPYSIEDALSTLFLDQQEIEAILLLWAAKKNLVLQGPPGVGKSYAAEKLAFALMEEAEHGRLGFVQFHQSYSYEDFVEGFRPTDKGFELKAGKFVRFCRQAEAHPSDTYVFVIDEINRGNLSKILGELMLLIESDKRGPDWAMPLASGTVPFHVPPNVYVLGLMNTADRSLAVVDYALRRRFAFVDLAPKIDTAKFADHLAANGIGKPVADMLINRIAALNKEIVEDTLNLGPGFAIGHSFFCGKPMPSETDVTWLKRIIKTEIAPLLSEYWYDAPQRAGEWRARLLENL